MERTLVWRRDEGETLIELVVALAILGVAAVAVLAGLMLSVRTSELHRNEASGGAYVRSLAEAIQNHVDSDGYAPCNDAATTYAGVPVPDLPADYTRSVTAVQSWNGSAWGDCTPDGIQRVELKITTSGDAGHSADETLIVILRKPCDGEATATGADPCA